MAAQFYTGRALKLLEKTILIRGDGSADVYCRSHFKCYRTTQNNFETKQPATSEIGQSRVAVNILVWPAQCGNPTKSLAKVGNAVIDGHRVKNGRVSWTVDRQSQLPIAEAFIYGSSYSVEPGACYVALIVRPTRKIVLQSGIDNSCGISITNGICKVESPLPGGNGASEESSRGRLTPKELDEASCGGYRLEMPYPLVDTRVKLEWSLASRLSPTGI
jgi:hypothetical protein